MASSKNKYSSVKLHWAKAQLESWMKYVEDNPFHEMDDRTKLRPTKGGGTILEVVATIEAQQKGIREIIKDYLMLIEVVKKLEQEDEAAEIKARGDEIIPDRMK